MTLQELKSSIEKNTFKPTSIILVDKDRFISSQYLSEIRSKVDMLYIESLNELSADNDIFSSSTEVDDSIQYVLHLEIVDFCSDVLYNNNVIIVTDKIEKESRNFYNKFVIEVPKLAEWQIKDMVYSLGSGLENKYLDWMFNNCKENVHRLYNELLKLKIFNQSEKETIFLEMCDDGTFDDITSNSVFDFSRAVIKRDVKTLRDVYEEIENIDVNEFGLWTILYNNFLNVVNIQLGINPTAEKLGLKQNQFNAIKYNCGRYSSTQLVKIFDFLSTIDLKIKTGQLDTKILIDYLVLSIMSM